MDYLQSFNLPFDNEKLTVPLKPILSRNHVRKELRKYGYRFISLETGFELTDLRDSDQYLRTTSWLTEFELGLLQPTVLPKIGQVLGMESLSQWRIHYRRVPKTFRTLGTLAKIPGPFFVFAHIVCPHPPFVFDSAGHFIEKQPGLFMSSGDALICPGLISREEHRAYYKSQLSFLNRQIEQMLDRLLAPGMPPSVIILQGDHGPDSGTFHRTPAATDLFERFGILMAIRLPEGLEASYPDNLTPVNLFRFILDREFGEKRPLLPDKSYTINIDQPYRYIYCSPEMLKP